MEGGRGRQEKGAGRCDGDGREGEGGREEGRGRQKRGKEEGKTRERGASRKRGEGKMKEKGKREGGRHSCIHLIKKYLFFSWVVFCPLGFPGLSTIQWENIYIRFVFSVNSSITLMCLDWGGGTI